MLRAYPADSLRIPAGCYLNLPILGPGSVRDAAGKEDGVPIYFVDPNPHVSRIQNLTVIAEPASVGVDKAIAALKEYFK